MQCICGQHQIWTSDKLSITCMWKSKFLQVDYLVWYSPYPPFHLECLPLWHKLTIYTFKCLKNRNCTPILSNVLEGLNSPWINFQISGHTAYVYLYHFNVQNSFALHDGFIVQYVVLKDVKVNFLRRFIHVSKKLSTV